VALKRHVVLGLDDLAALRRLRKCRVRIADDGRSGAGRRLRFSHVGVQIVGRWERRDVGLLPVRLEPFCRRNRLFFTLAHDGDVVAFADDLDEAGKATDRRLVDADQLRASHRRLHVSSVNHAGRSHVDRPLQRAVDFRRDVVPLRRAPDDLEFLYRLHLGDAGGRVDVLAGERHVELLSADQLPVRDVLRRVGLHRDDARADGERARGYSEPRRCHVEEDAPSLGRDAPHRPAVGLDGVRAAGPALIDRHVGAAHDARRLVVLHVELVGHQLTEGRPGSLSAVGLADEERRGVVLMDRDPRVELPEVGIRIRAGNLHRGFERAGVFRRRDADDQHA
jgi:hypothetical protein